MKRRPAILAAFALAITPTGATLAQITGGSSSSTPTTGDVSAGTWGSGTTDQNSVGVSGGGTAEAANGGTASTDSSAKFNDKRAMQRSVATARDEDERARSRTRTTVRKGGELRSNSMSIYKERGEKPVIDRERTRTTADGTTSSGNRKP
jgi:hypothetical protein